MSMPPPPKHSITVTIDGETLEGLKSLKRTLALVWDLNVDGQLQNGNVVLATTEAKDLKTSQTFTWEETYKVYATQVGFENDRLVDESETSHSKPQAIQRGQKATIGSKEVSVEGDVDDTKPIEVVNSWKNNAHAVIGCKNSEEVTPFYIFPTMGLNNLRELTPAQSFFVFFDNAFTKTKTMVDIRAKGVTGHFQFNDGAKDCTVSYTASGDDPTKYWKSEDATKL